MTAEKTDNPRSHLDHEQRSRCIVCGGSEVELFFKVSRAPVQCNVLWSSREKALAAPTGPISLGFCSSCGHIFNTAYDSSLVEYTERYENSLHFSPRFQTFLDSLITRLDDRYALSDKHVIDVGCGKGEFLSALCERTGCYGVGFDRSYEPEGHENGSNSRTRFVVDFYDERYASCPADLITCRHVLEHIDRPADFVAMIRRSVGTRYETAIFFEVPNAMFTVRDLGIWDIIYEHVSFFTAQSLQRLFEQNGFSVTELTAEYNDQYLTLHALPRHDEDRTFNSDAEGIKAICGDVRRFRERYERKQREWEQALQNIRSSSRTAVVWGAGSKGVTFLNTLGITDAIQYAVDLNPRKSGLFVPGTAQRVVGPELLSTIDPDLVIVMNAIYQEEIKGILSSMDVTAEVVVA